jgi:hypothetical protein
MLTKSIFLKIRYSIYAYTVYYTVRHVKAEYFKFRHDCTGYLSIRYVNPVY